MCMSHEKIFGAYIHLFSFVVEPLAQHGQVPTHTRMGMWSSGRAA
jgi:hypothetical protein